MQPEESRRLGAFLDIRPDERRLVALLVAHSACLGLVRVAAETSANALFVQSYGAAALPLAFLGAALSNPLVSLAYSRVGARVTFGRLLEISLWALLLGLFLCRGLLALGQSWPSLLLVVFYHTVYLLTGLEFWGLCSRLFDVRQAKRLLGLIGSGELAAQIVLGLSIGQIVAAVGTANLLWISLLGIFGCLLLLRAIRRDAENQLDQPEENQEAASPLPAPRQMLREPYLLLLWAATAGYTVCSCFIFQIFYDVASLRYSSEDQLAGFLGLYQAVSGGLALITGGFVTSFLLERFGLSSGLLCFPIGVGLVGLAVTGASFGKAPLLLIFFLVVLLKLQDDTLFDTLYRPAFQTLRQPLPSDQRSTALTVGEGLVEPIFGGMSGLLLLAITHWLHLGVGLQAAILAGFALGWTMVCLYLSRGYRRVLLLSLSRKIMQEARPETRPTRRSSCYYRTAPQTDSNSVKALGEAMDSPHPGVVIYVLKLLREIAPHAWLGWLRRNLSHASPLVRKHVLEQMEEHQVDSALPSVEALFAKESDPEVRGAAARAMASLRGGDLLDQLSPFLESDQVQLKQGVLVGLLKSGELEGIILAGEHLNRMVRSPQSEERGLAARILAEVGNAGLYRPVLKLLADPEPDVRAEALQAAGKLRSPRLWALVLENLSHPHLRGLAANALKLGGEQMMAELDVYFSRPDQTTAMRLRLTRIAGRVEHALATEWLQNKLDDPSQTVRHQAMAALCRRKFQAKGTIATRLQQRLEVEISHSTRLGEIRQKLSAEQQLVHSALSYQLRLGRQGILLCLSLLYDPEVMQKVRENLSDDASPGARAAALEVLDVILPRPFKIKALPLLELAASAGPAAAVVPTGVLLAEIAESEQYSDWTRACARHQLQTQSLERTGQMLTAIEKVIILKRVSLFAETPDEVLNETAEALEEVDLPAGRTLFQAGDMGNRMYIIVFGQVKVHLQDKTLNTLGPGEIFGEMSLLDSEPRTASVTTTESTRLLQLSQDALYELMSDHSEVMRGIIRFLTSNLRARLHDSDRR